MKTCVCDEKAIFVSYNMGGVKGKWANLDLHFGWLLCLNIYMSMNLRDVRIQLYWRGPVRTKSRLILKALGGMTYLSCFFSTMGRNFWWLLIPRTFS